MLRYDVLLEMDFARLLGSMLGDDCQDVVSVGCGLLRIVQSLLVRATANSSITSCIVQSLLVRATANCRIVQSLRALWHFGLLRSVQSLRALFGLLRLVQSLLALDYCEECNHFVHCSYHTCRCLVSRLFAHQLLYNHLSFTCTIGRRHRYAETHRACSSV